MADKGKYKRTCANPKCRKVFFTDDKRKKYDTRECGHAARCKRWYDRAAAALRAQKEAQAA